MALNRDQIMAGVPSPETLEYLLRRRSVKPQNLAEPGPSRAQVETILTAAARVPDHGKLAPWRFIVFEGEARREAGKLLAGAFLADEDPAAAPVKLELEAGKFLRAPVVIAVVSSLKEGKIPEWEQVLSAGASCMNMVLAANALGFGANWLTGWMASSKTFCRSLGLDEASERIAGLIYIGTASETPEDRDRPDTGALATYF